MTLWVMNDRFASVRAMSASPPKASRIATGRNSAVGDNPLPMSAKLVVLSKMLADDFDHAIGGRAGRKEAEIFPRSAHQIDEAGVIDQIDGAVGRLIFGVIGLVGVRHGADLCRAFR